MKVLMLCTKFSLDENDPWLTNELADSLSAIGHEVDVVLVDWAAVGNKRTNELRTSTGVRVVAVSPVTVGPAGSRLAKSSKWVFSSARAWNAVRRLVADRRHELVIAYSPAVTMALPIVQATLGGRRRSYFIQWDFFPHHHLQIGLLRSRLAFAVAKAAEAYLIRRFDVIGCMSQRNIEYLTTHYRLRRHQRIEHLPIWGGRSTIPETDRMAVRKAYGLPQAPIAVFGGQLSAGRGVEDIIAAAAIAAERGLPLVFLLIGDGPLKDLVADAIARGIYSIIWLRRIPRNEYMQVIASCDIALVCTVRHVDVPTFPSKTIDYLRAGLPIVASVEAATDFGDYLTSRGLGLSVEAGDAAGLVDGIEALLADPARLEQIKSRGPACFEEDFEVGLVTQKLLAAAFK